jgi:hypothetical protein
MRPVGSAAEVVGSVALAGPVGVGLASDPVGMKDESGGCLN